MNAELYSELDFCEIQQQSFVLILLHLQVYSFFIILY